MSAKQSLINELQQFFFVKYVQNQSSLAFEAKQERKKLGIKRLI